MGRLRLGSKNLAEVTLEIPDLGQFTPGYVGMRCTGLQPCRIPGSQPTAPPVVMCQPNTCVRRVAHGRAGCCRDPVQILWQCLRVPGVGGSQSLLMSRKLKDGQRLRAGFAAWASSTPWPNSEIPLTVSSCPLGSVGWSIVLDLLLSSLKLLGESLKGYPRSWRCRWGRPPRLGVDWGRTASARSLPSATETYG